MQVKKRVRNFLRNLIDAVTLEELRLDRMSRQCCSGFQSKSMYIERYVPGGGGRSLSTVVARKLIAPHLCVGMFVTASHSAPAAIKTCDSRPLILNHHVPTTSKITYQEIRAATFAVPIEKPRYNNYHTFQTRSSAENL